MNSAEDVDPPASGGHDERLLRAFDRVARLGIDLEDDDALGERESAAVRAFAALHLDGEPGGTPAHPGGAPIDVADVADLTDPAPPLPPYDVPPPDEVPRGDDLPPRDDVAPPRDDVAPPEDEPSPGAPTPPSAPPDADGPLRPDAVLRNRRFTPRDDEFDAGHDVAAGIEVEVPPPPPQAPASDPHGADATHQPEAAGAARAGAAEPASIAPAVAHGAAFDPPERAGDGYVLDIVALGVASGAFVWPWAWPLAVAGAVVVGTVASSVAAHGRSMGGLAQRTVGRLLACLRPRALMGGGIVVARTVLLAVVIPALACGGWWIITQGLNGALVAARIGVWAHGVRVAAAVVCFVLVVGLGEARQRREALVRGVTGRLGVTAVTLVASTVLVGALAVAVLGPRGGAGWASTDDWLAWVPGRWHDNVDRVRHDVVTAEVHAASGCLSDQQGLTWRSGYASADPQAADDVVRLMADDDTPSPAQLATAAAALHNQLAPWVEGIELEAGGDTVVVLDRRDLPAGRPLVDPDELVGAARSGGGRLVEGADGFDRAIALSCSAAPLP